MQRKLIQAGTEYVTASSAINLYGAERVKVVDLGPFKAQSGFHRFGQAPEPGPTEVIDGETVKNTIRDPKGDLIAVRLLPNPLYSRSHVRQGVVLIKPRTVQLTWADYEERRDREQKQRDASEVERVERRRRTDELKAQADSLGIPALFLLDRAAVTVSHDVFARLLASLESSSADLPA